jgi:EmrB/QacA subfamily drug resistance transporter
MLSVMASLFLVALDQTIIATALGRIVEDFNAYSALGWVITAYLLTTTITVPIAGKLSDIFGRRIILLVGVSLFGIGSLMSGMSANIEQLVAWRAFQGIGGGIITANAFTIIGDLFAARERGRWQGIIGAVFGLSSLVGPLLGGWLTDPHNIFGLETSWRWTFWINVPIAIVAFIIIALLCPPLRYKGRVIIDYMGAAFLTVALGTFVLAVDNTEQIFKDILSGSGLGIVGLRAILFTVVLVALIGFVVKERRAREPILPLYFFKNRNYIFIIAIATLFGAAFLGSILYLTQFNQQVFGASPTESGLMLLPMVGGLMVAAISSGQIIARTGKYKVLMQSGVLLATVMIFMLSTLEPTSSYVYEAVLTSLLGIGLGAVMPIMNIAVQNEFSLRELGVATSSSQLFRSLGSTLGVAIFGALLTSGITSNLVLAQNDAYLQGLSQQPISNQFGDLSDSNTLLMLNTADMKSKIRENFKMQLAESPQPAAIKQQLIATFEKQQSDYSEKVAFAFSDSLQRVFIVSSLLMLAASVLVFMLRERELKSASSEQTPGIA